MKERETDAVADELINNANEAQTAEDYGKALAYAKRAERLGVAGYTPLARLAQANALAALGRSDEASIIWRAVRDDVDSDALDPLLSVRAAANLVSQGLTDARDREDLVRLVSARLKAGKLKDVNAGLPNLAYDALRSLFDLASFGDVTCICRALLALKYFDGLGLSTKRIMRTRLYDMIANMELRRSNEVSERFAEIVTGEELALEVLDDWQAGLDDAAERAPVYMALTAAYMRAIVLDRLGRGATASSVLSKAIKERDSNGDPNSDAVLVQIRALQRTVESTRS